MTIMEFWRELDRIEIAHGYDMFAEDADEKHIDIAVELIEKLALQGERITGHSDGRGMIAYRLITDDRRQIDIIFMPKKVGFLTTVLI